MAFGALYRISIHTCSPPNMVRISKLKCKNLFLMAKRPGGKKAQQPRTRMPIVVMTRIMLAAGTRMVPEVRKTPWGRMNPKSKVPPVEEFIHGCPTLPLPSCHISLGVNPIPLHPPVVLRVRLSVGGRHLPGGGCVEL